jgi:phage tail sheath protein FI
VPTYTTPGVYYERVDASPLGIAAIRTDIAGFVGIASRGPLHTPVPVQSWRQFQAYFGDFTGVGYLAYAVRAFFENGGSKCWVVRVASDLAAEADVSIPGLFVGPRVDLWRIAAFSPGIFGNNLDITLRETHVAQTLIAANNSSLETSKVASVAGFSRATHVRLSQDGKKGCVWKVVSDVDAINQQLIWVSPKPEARLPYDAPLTGFDPNQPILVESVEYTLLVHELGRLVRVYTNLSLVPEHPKYGPALLSGSRLPRTCGETQDLQMSPEPILIELAPGMDTAHWLSQGLLPLASWDRANNKAISLSADATLPLNGGADGLALLSVHDFIGEEISPLDSDTVKQQKRRGMRAIEEVCEVSIIAVPDIHIQPMPSPLKSPFPPCTPDPCLPSGLPTTAIPRLSALGDFPPVFSLEDIFQVQAALVQQCEKLRDRIAVLDPPYAVSRNDALRIGSVQAWRQRFDSNYAAFYYPWLKVVDPLRETSALTRDIPPSGHVAGQYALTDNQVGVHKAPANAPLVWVQDVTVFVGDTEHGIFNPQGINAIRPLAGRGLRIFGARTVSSNSDFRYVNVRRLLMMVEKAIYISTQWAVFEPNDAFTRAKFRLSLTSYLLALWQKGALIGNTANQAFFIKCDESNNPDADRNNGKLQADIGIAPSKPFEFVVLRVGRIDNKFEISEASGSALAGGLF